MKKKGRKKKKQRIKGRKEENWKKIERRFVQIQIIVSSINRKNKKHKKWIKKEEWKHKNKENVKKFVKKQKKTENNVQNGRRKNFMIEKDRGWNEKNDSLKRMEERKRKQMNEKRKEENFHKESKKDLLKLQFKQMPIIWT